MTMELESNQSQSNQSQSNQSQSNQSEQSGELIPLAHQTEDPAVHDLFEEIMLLEPHKIPEQLVQYASRPDYELMGFREEGELRGLIGVRYVDSHRTELLHLVVKPEYRLKGLGQGLVYMLAEKRELQQITAQIEEEMLEFFRRIGFGVHSYLDEQTGREQFRCEWNREHSIQE
ncbi:GNAT family N-acetyltransferase [Marinicrinis sediminis]|uniref:GNAT family N-acetyltransferase n=1 Tax=Marinicrinis sediminis TaxID=1652465 RepID=A0ABW5RDQ8_9BACL